MATEVKKEIELEIGHVLFIDIVGYSKLLINEQRALLDMLNQIVRGTNQFHNAEVAGKLVKIPTGDGMVLVFYSSPEAPVECALEISRALKNRPELKLRMGVHSGPVSGVVDVNERANVAGAGINVAQRVMDCGDAGHILLSKHVAEDLEQYGHWQPHLHDLGEMEVKHGVRVHVVNLYTDELGNTDVPEKFRLAKENEQVAATARSVPRRKSLPVMVVILIFSLLGLAIVAVIFAPAVTKFVSHQRAMATPNPASFASPAPSAPTIQEKSIAVLPFENLSRDPDNAYFATGIQDEILTRLAKIAALKVISHNSTQQYAARPGNLREIGRQLGVANILEGSVQKAADQVHINVQLIRAATDEHLWAESYDRKLENIFSVEAEVATAVAEALKAKLTGAEQQALEQKLTNNPAAYDAYLRALALWREPNAVARLKAAPELEEAVRLDPDFAVAWALLTRADSLAFLNYATSERRAAAQKSLDTVLKLKPDLSEVQLAKGFFQYWVLRDWNAARETFEQLRPKLPNSADIAEALYIINVRQGRWEEARASTDQAIALNPRDPLLRLEHAWIRHAMRDFAGALRYFDEALNLWPDDPALISCKADVYQALGQLDEAGALVDRLHPTSDNPVGLDTLCYQAILRRHPESAIPRLQDWLDRAGGSLPWWRNRSRLSLGDLKRLSGDNAGANTSYSQTRDELEQALKEQPANAYWICEALAKTYAGLGDRERALNFIDRALSLAPASKDPSVAPVFEESRARIAARFGMKDIAIPILERLVNASYNDPITPALLRLDPDFDLLRGDARFEKLAHSDAPK